MIGSILYAVVLTHSIMSMVEKIIIFSYSLIYGDKAVNLLSFLSMSVRQDSLLTVHREYVVLLR